MTHPHPPSHHPATITFDAPWRWLGAGLRDMMRAPLLSIGYGVFIIGGRLGHHLWTLGRKALFTHTCRVWLLCAYLARFWRSAWYEMSRRIEANERPRLYPVRFANPKAFIQLAYLGFFLMFAALVWARIALILYALFTNGSYLPIDQFLSFAITTGSGLAMITIGSIIGGAIAFAIFTTLRHFRCP